MSVIDELREERIKKLNLLKESGAEAYPISSERNLAIDEALKNFSKLARAKKKHVLAGRLLAVRGHGGVVFADLYDGSGKIQILFKKDEVGEKKFGLLGSVIDIGDIVEAKGNFFLTKRKEKTLNVIDWKMLAKSLRPLPDKWHGLQDVEEKYRKRHVGLIMDEETKSRFITRSKIISGIRNFLIASGYLEVETPALQPLAGGASAEPFKTRHNTLDMDMFLRIAPELYLKKLLIGGFPKVFEFGRNFRNEGVDVTHNPEFSTVEFYEAYSDASKQRDFIEKMLKALVKNTLKKKEVEYNGNKIDFSKKFSVVSYNEMLKRHALITHPETATREDFAVKAKQLGIDFKEKDSKEKIMDAIFKKMARPKLIQPTFVVDYPVNMLPLAKKKNRSVVDAFQFYAGGLELVKAFSELNDPFDQRERFTEQEKARMSGDKEAQIADEEFIEALEYGMPPAGGVGIGIDRLAMFFTNTQNIRDVILFPTLRPK